MREVLQYLKRLLPPLFIFTSGVLANAACIAVLNYGASPPLNTQFAAFAFLWAPALAQILFGLWVALPTYSPTVKKKVGENTFKALIIPNAAWAVTGLAIYAHTGQAHDSPGVYVAGIGAVFTWSLLAESIYTIYASHKYREESQSD